MSKFNLGVTSHSPQPTQITFSCESRAWHAMTPELKHNETCRADVLRFDGGIDRIGRAIVCLIGHWTDHSIANRSDNQRLVNGQLSCMSDHSVTETGRLTLRKGQNKLINHSRVVWVYILRFLGSNPPNESIPAIKVRKCPKICQKSMENPLPEIRTHQIFSGYVPEK